MLGITIKAQHMKSNYFNVIDSPQKAYWLGFLAADGCVVKRDINRKFQVRIQLQNKPEELSLLNSFKAELDSHRPVVVRVYLDKNREFCEFIFNDKEIYRALESHGVTPLKSKTLVFPTTIPNELLRHYVRGFFDGDGWIGINSKRKNWWSYINVGFIAPEHFLIELNKIISRETGVNPAALCPKSSIHQMTWSGRRVSETILDWIYKDSTIHLDRKYKIYKSFKEKVIENSKDGSKLVCPKCSFVGMRFWGSKVFKKSGNRRRFKCESCQRYSFAAITSLAS